MSKPSFTDEFKEGVVQYVLEHPEEAKVVVAKQFGIADSTIHKWIKEAQKNNGTINSRGSGNYASDEVKEIDAPSDESRDVIDILTYVLRYTGRPVMAQSRIEAYIQEEDAVIWHYIDHETEERVDVVDSSVSFMKKLILHIPDENFKMIRFYGCYASKNHRYRKLVTHIINNVKHYNQHLFQSVSNFRRSIMIQFNRDPIKCRCGCQMEYVESYAPT